MSRAIFEAATGYRAPPPMPAVESFGGRGASSTLERVHALTRESVEEAKGRLVGEGARRVVRDALHVSPVTATVREPNDRLLAILLADQPMTTDERAFVDACERGEFEA
jgi:hypothetical protein